MLNESGRIEQDALARLFGVRYRKDPRRGYGGTAHDILQKIHLGLPWREVSAEVFGGGGSMGNGAAMRVAPLGAWFADDLKRVASEARASAEVTHFHPEGQAGAIAIAVASAWAHRWRESRMPARQLFDVVLDHTPAARCDSHVGSASAGQRAAGHLPGHGALLRVVRCPPPG